VVGTGQDVNRQNAEITAQRAAVASRRGGEPFPQRHMRKPRSSRRDGNLYDDNGKPSAAI
jgi:hypothetical protein